MKVDLGQAYRDKVEGRPMDRAEMKLHGMNPNLEPLRTREEGPTIPPCPCRECVAKRSTAYGSIAGGRKRDPEKLGDFERAALAGKAQLAAVGETDWTEVSGPTTYNINANCSNCGYKGTVTVPLGQERPRLTTCPFCQCFTYKTGW